jgi:hypothetical protein
MSKFGSPLNNIRIASPCSANWNEMFGDERKRFCGECKLNVYNLSGMARDEAENLLMMSEGRVCVRYYKRADGTVLTKDCPVGWARIKRRVSAAATAVFSLVLSLFSGLFITSLFNRKSASKPSFPTVPILSPKPQPLMGAIRVDPKPEPNKPQPENEDMIPIKRKVMRQAGV